MMVMCLRLAHSLEGNDRIARDSVNRLIKHCCIPATAAGATMVYITTATQHAPSLQPQPTLPVD
jgi:hypothetical protein